MSLPRIVGVLLLALSLASQLHADAQQADPLVGKWFWWNGGTAIFHEDGTCELEKDTLKGTWQYLHNPENERKYLLNWDHGRFLNRLVLSGDGKNARVEDTTQNIKFKARKYTD